MEYDHHIIPNNFCIGYYCIFGMGKRKIEGSTEPNKISRLSSFGFTSSKAASLLNSDHAHMIWTSTTGDLFLLEIHDHIGTVEIC